MDLARKRLFNSLEESLVFEDQCNKKKAENENEQNCASDMSPLQVPKVHKKLQNSFKHHSVENLTHSTETNKRKRKQSECDNVHSSSDSGVDSEVSKKNKKKNEQQQSEVTSLKRKKLVDGEDREELLSCSLSHEVIKHDQKKKQLLGNEQEKGLFVEAQNMKSPSVTPKKKKITSEGAIKAELDSPISLNEASTKQTSVEISEWEIEKQLFSQCDNLESQSETHSPFMKKSKKHKKKDKDNEKHGHSIDKKKKKHLNDSNVNKELYSPGPSLSGNKAVELGSGVKKELFSPRKKHKKNRKHTGQGQESEHENLHTEIDLGVDFPSKLEQLSETSVTESEINESLIATPLHKKSKNKEKHLPNRRIAEDSYMSTDYSFDGSFNITESSLLQEYEKENREKIGSNDTTPKRSKSTDKEKKMRKNSQVVEHEDASFQIDVKRQRKNSVRSKDHKHHCSLKIKHLLSPQNSEAEVTPPSNKFSLEKKVKKIREKNRLSHIEQMNLKELNVKLPWPTPPLHLIETRVAVRPTEAQRTEIEKLAVPVKTGPYSAVEDAQIRANWEDFCNAHNLPEDPKPFLSLINPEKQVTIPTSERIKFVRFLAHDLDNRLLCSVFNRFRRLYQPQQLAKGRFTPHEDKTIVEYIQNSSRRTPYSDLATLLNRTKTSVEKRALKLAQKQNSGSSVIKWDRKKVQEFLTHFVEVTEVADVKDLKEKKITTEHWRQMEDIMQIPKLKIRNAWTNTIYPQIFVKRRLSRARVKESLLKLLIQRSDDDFKTINWSAIRDELTKEYEGFTEQNLYRMLQVMIHYHVPETKRRNLKACLKYLQDAVKNGEIGGQKIKRLKVIDNREAVP